MRFTKMHGLGNDYLYVILYGKKNNKYIFFYNFKLKLDYNELQADGKILKDYFKVKSDGDYFSYSLINIDNNVDNLILYFDDNVLNMENRTDFYPNILLKDAVDNCCLKNNMKKVRIKR